MASTLAAQQGAAGALNPFASQTHLTSEGFELERPLLLADARAFCDVLEYVREWDHERMTAHPDPALVVAPRLIHCGHKPRAEQPGNWIGPLCDVELEELGGPARRTIAVRATDAVIAALKGQLVTDDDRLYFLIRGHADTNRALVVLRHNRIIGERWLAYIDPQTIPPYPYAQRDQRLRELCDTMRESAREPFSTRLPDGEIEISASDDGPPIKAILHADGGLTLTWGDGRSNYEPPRDPDEARRAREQLAQAAPAAQRNDGGRPPAASAGRRQPRAQPGEGGGAPQTTLFDEPVRQGSAGEAEPRQAGPVRRTTIDQKALEVLSRATVSENTVTLPQQLERSLYEAVNKALAALGGKWDRRRKGHVFPEGQAVGDQLAAALESGFVERALNGYFPTPRALAAQLIALADVRAEHTVIEPSAGRGAISDLLAEIVPAERLYLVELDEANHTALEQAGYRPPQLIHGDFLTTDALPGAVERIVMNPPFEDKQDVRHVMHAYELLTPGGRLAAIMSTSIRFREDTLTKGFRELLESLPGSSVSENPAGSFKESGTAVHTVTVVMAKPAS